MTTTPLQGGQLSKETESAACDHTELHKNHSGELLGTWIEIPMEGRIRVECRVCRTLYGTLSEPLQDAAMRELFFVNRDGCPAPAAVKNHS